MLKSIFNFIDDVIRGIIVTFLLIAFTIISALALVFCDMGEFMRMGAVILLMTSVGAIFYILSYPEEEEEDTEDEELE